VAERIDDEQVGAPAVLKGIEHEPDPVVVAEAFAPGQGCAHASRLPVTRDEHDVEVIGVIGEIRLGRLACRHAVAGFALDERRDRDFIGPRRAVQIVFEGRWRGDSRYREGAFARGWRLGRGRGPGEQQKEKDDWDHLTPDCPTS
jgi:hypothetical protein